MDFMDQVLNNENSKEPEYYLALGCDRSSTVRFLLNDLLAVINWGGSD